ncbi:Protein export cytoplasm protein SecA ATPase RNA helicase (TC 3.A.5.1.1) [Patulibacter medicamentivorans]|uniref:Protein translocase subunit SecA n=1 Tax=Patulibacter medicamentivorans TaxID=1097667 RepID=H0E4J1_9ACTN|nr:preprotein translocase subunit SecA [Patulibacter medicamentivorans]EHN11397.1 Protein export cytoplasm protein SecA ATPase RNA helicase (TC 3.A.5.1.1) [Patulibacter medicamentivorans]
MGLLSRALSIGEGKQLRDYEKRVAQINAFEPELELATDDELRERFAELREEAKSGTSLDDLLPESFAITREMSKRVLGMRHFDVQLVGAQVLHGGDIAEMKTGEGKTLTATLAVVLNALPGHGVHVVTVNDYLAERDAEWMGRLYTALGLSVGILQNMQPHEVKRAAYAADITYGTNSEFGFDYLRDNMAQTLEEKVQHGGRIGEDGRPVAMHNFAIVDEVDNILIDEARTPLIISGAPEQAADLYVTFAKMAKTMVPGKKPEGMDPRTKKEFVADFDFEFDEKHKTVAVTERGVEKAERFLGIDHLYRAENGHLVNHLHQALKAESLYKRDVDYAVVNGEVAIIDEHTGRILEGRRWSEGLHQAVEAKEGVAIQEENQTLATVTLQNFFRMYKKLAGMTGTALTEATEFMKIYKLGVVPVPTNQPVARVDNNDDVFKTKDGKWAAVTREVVERHARQQPVLVGTVSVEVSELLGGMFRKAGIPHTVLNAKPEHAAIEGETVAEAGRPGAVTIATNMAGRGVDIKLGGDPEHLLRKELRKEGLSPGDEGYDEAFASRIDAARERCAADREIVVAAGGLFICGTERHESRRIDNQLRGRAGRQGDPGESRFFLSAQDDLVRIFAGDRIYKILDRFPSTDDDGNELPISAGMLTKQIEKAQRTVEERNFLIRKRVLEYDDVQNEQRRVVYAYRDQILEGRDMSDDAQDEVGNVITRALDEYLPSEDFEAWDMDGLFTALEEIWSVTIDREELDPDTVDREDLQRRLHDDAIAAYELREKQLGPDLMRQVERYLLLNIIDQRWREHLYDMDYLREGIHLRGYAQIEPIVAYKNEAYDLFQDLMATIWSDFAKLVFHVEVEVEDADAGLQPPASAPSAPSAYQYTSGADAAPSALAVASDDVEGAALAAYGSPDEDPDAPPPVQQRVLASNEQLGRNDLCWCGSGRKYKRCHGAS